MTILFLLLLILTTNFKFIHLKESKTVLENYWSYYRGKVD